MANNYNAIKLATEKMTIKIKEYIATHKELQQDAVSIGDMKKCGNECGCHFTYVDQVIMFGKIFQYDTIENGKFKTYRF